MCALHLDKPHHLHIHFVFWEKEPKIRGKDGNKCYRAKGKISKAAIDNMFVRLGLYVGGNRADLYQTRLTALKELREMTAIQTAMKSTEAIKDALLALAEALPDTGRLTYGSKDMEPFRERVDKIVRLMLDYDGKARRADNRFHRALERKRAEIANACGKDFTFSTQNVPEEEMLGDLPKYHHQIDPETIKIADEIEEDYKRRQGNLVLGLAKFIKNAKYKPRDGKNKANNTKLKRSLTISNKRIDGMIKRFFMSFGEKSEWLERDFCDRLQQIEAEIEQERKAKNKEEYKT